MQQGSTTPVMESSLLIPPSDDLPGYAQEAILLRGLQVPSKSFYVSSGFEYPRVLQRAGVSEESWSAFTLEIQQHAKLTSSQWLTTIGGATGTLALGSMMVGFFGVGGAAVIGHKMRRKHEKQNLRAAKESGALPQCVKRWNEDYFMPRRLIVRVDIPGDAEDLDTMDVAEGGSTVRDGKARSKAGRRGRIVIIPTDSTMTPRSSSLTKSDNPKELTFETRELNDNDLYEDSSKSRTSSTGRRGLSMFSGSSRGSSFDYPDEPKP